MNKKLVDSSFADNRAIYFNLVWMNKKLVDSSFADNRAIYFNLVWHVNITRNRFNIFSLFPIKHITSIYFILFWLLRNIIHGLVVLYGIVIFSNINLILFWFKYKILVLLIYIFEGWFNICIMIIINYNTIYNIISLNKNVHVLIFNHNIIWDCLRCVLSIPPYIYIRYI